MCGFIPPLAHMCFTEHQGNFNFFTLLTVKHVIVKINCILSGACYYPVSDAQNLLVSEHLNIHSSINDIVPEDMSSTLTLCNDDRAIAYHPTDDAGLVLLYSSNCEH
jgi:hypothetical protein